MYFQTHSKSWIKKREEEHVSCDAESPMHVPTCPGLYRTKISVSLNAQMSCLSYVGVVIL
jgi:hypothetical protein